MAATPDVAPAQKPIEFKPIEVLSYGQESRARTPPAIKQSRDRGEALKELRGQQVSGKDVIRARLEQEKDIDYSSISVESDKVSFGAGAAKIEDGKAEISDAARPEQKAIFDQAADLIDKTAKVHDYLEILAVGDDSAKQNEKLDQLKSQGRKHLESTSDFAQLKSEAFDYILADPSFQAFFPELTKMNNDQKMTFIEDKLLKDPKLRAIYSRNLQQVHDTLSKLPEVKGNEAEQTLKTQLKEKETGLASNVTRAYELLNKKYQGVISRDRLIEIIDQSVDIQDALRVLQSDLVDTYVPRFNDIVEYTAIQPEVDSLETKIGEVIKGLQGRSPSEDSPQAKEIQTYRTKIDGLHTRKTELESDQAFIKQVGEYQVIQRLLFPQQGSNELVSNLNNALTSNNTAETLRHQIDQLSPSTEQQKQIRERLSAESRVLGKLERVWVESLAEFMEGRYDEMVEVEQKRLAKEAEDTKKTQGEEQAKMVEKLAKAERTNWIELDSIDRSKKLHHDKIGEDMRFLAYAGSKEEGVKHLILRDTLCDSAGNITVDKLGPDGKPQVDPVSGNIIKESLSWEDISLSRLSEQQKKILDGLYTAQGSGYSKKLFADYYLARSCITDRTLGIKIFGRNLFERPIGDMALKDHEWVMLQKQFGTDIDAGLKESKGAQDIMDKMKKEGLIPGFKLKWLLYLLIILGIGFGAAGIFASKG